MIYILVLSASSVPGRSAPLYALASPLSSPSAVWLSVVPPCLLPSPSRDPLSLDFARSSLSLRLPCDFCVGPRCLSAFVSVAVSLLALARCVSFYFYVTLFAD